MTFKAKITFKYDSEWALGGDEFLPEEHFVMEFPSDDLNSCQIFNAFRKFLLASGFSDTAIRSGATSLAFNDSLTPDQMRTTAENYDLVLKEDHDEKIEELENKIHMLEIEIIDLNAHLSRAKNPLNANYTEEEMEAMCLHAQEKMVTKKTLEKAYKVCAECGDKYGDYKGGVSSWWQDTCDVCGGNKAVTEARDFHYLKSGIEELSK